MFAVTIITFHWLLAHTLLSFTSFTTAKLFTFSRETDSLLVMSSANSTRTTSNCFTFLYSLHSLSLQHGTICECCLVALRNSPKHYSLPIIIKASIIPLTCSCQQPLHCFQLSPFLASPKQHTKHTFCQPWHTASRRSWRLGTICCPVNTNFLEFIVL